MMKVCFETHSESETRQLGSKMGAALRGGEIFELTSDVGGGKTTLTKAIVSGAGSTNLVHSPTFTVSNVYDAGDLEIHHYDFYRIDQLGLMSEELEEVLESKNAVVIIEWAGEAHELLPDDRLIRIQLKRTSESEDSRILELETHTSFLDEAKIGGTAC